MNRTLAGALCSLWIMAQACAASAETIKVAVPVGRDWNLSFVQLGMQQNFFREQGLDVEIVRPDGETALEKALVSGEADIGVAANFPDVLAAFSKGASVRIISSQTTGAPDIFWAAKIAGPIGSMADLHGQPVGFEGPGTLSAFVLRNLLKQAGVEDARLVAVGRADYGFPMLLNAEVVATWGGPSAGAKDLTSGEVRLIARGDETAAVRDLTTRVNVANTDFLAKRRDTAIAFLKAYRRSVDWAYASTDALTAYAKLSEMSLEFAKYVVGQFASKEANQFDDIKGEDTALAWALDSGFVPKALTHGDVERAYDILSKPSP